ncbi:MAG: 4Fe-4S binding protein, partial [Nitrospirae bacterium]|nr:4Fe-4S binding protein [Nitrospirota bacterium]
MTKIKLLQPWRRLVEALQAVIIIGLPFISIKGESALRFDIPSLRLHFFGVSLLMDEFFLVLVALIFLTFLVVLITLMFGRIWCGWVCPQTVLVDFTRFLDRADATGLAYRLFLYAVTFLTSLVVAASLIWYFISPYEFIGRLVTGNLGTVIGGFWGVMSAIIFLNLAFLRHRFCATVCPYAKLQSVLFDKATLVIAFDPGRKEECMNCMACVRTCPVGVDIRNGLNPACINCAECIDKCSVMMGRMQKKGLISYFFGAPGYKSPLLRQNVIMTGSVTIFFFIFLLYLSLSRMPFDMTILPNYDYPPRITADNQGINSYLLSFENRGKTDMDIRISARGSHGDISIVPERVFLRAGEYKKMPVYVTVSGT